MPPRKVLLPVFFALVTLALAGGLWWQRSALLQQVPSRYLARLPAPLQTLTAPPAPAALLPTAAPPQDAVRLLGAPATLPPPLVSVRERAGATPPGGTPAPTPTRRALATPTPALPAPPAAVRLEGFRHQFQTWNNCGPATIAMALSYFGMDLSQKQTAAVLKPDPEDRNVSPYEMAAYVDEQTPYAALERVDGSLETAKRLLAAGFPVIIELGIEPPGEYRWLGWYGHYLLLVAYDDAQGQFWVYDSWFGTSEVPMENATSEGRPLPYAAADRQWRQFNRAYIVLYEPERAAEVEAIVGAGPDDEAMWQAALNRTRAELQEEPENGFLWFNLGSSYVALGEIEQATAAFDQARALGLPWRMLWYQFGPYEAYFQGGRYEDVILLADNTLKDRPYFEEAYYYKGLALAARGEQAAAREHWERAIAFNPNFAPAAQALAATQP